VKLAGTGGIMRPVPACRLAVQAEAFPVIALSGILSSVLHPQIEMIKMIFFSIISISVAEGRAACG